MSENESGVAPNAGDPVRELALERRAHAITRGLLQSTTQELAGATLALEELLTAVQSAQEKTSPQTGAEETHNG